MPSSQFRTKLMWSLWTSTSGPPQETSLSMYSSSHSIDSSSVCVGRDGAGRKSFLSFRPCLPIGFASGVFINPVVGHVLDFLWKRLAWSPLDGFAASHSPSFEVTGWAEDIKSSVRSPKSLPKPESIKADGTGLALSTLATAKKQTRNVIILKTFTRIAFATLISTSQKVL